MTRDEIDARADENQRLVTLLKAVGVQQHTASSLMSAIITHIEGRADALEKELDNLTR